MKQLKGLRTGSASKIWELFKAVYSLKQAPRVWSIFLMLEVGSSWVGAE